MPTLFAKATAGVALLPLERAVLRFLRSLWLTVLVASAPVLSDLVAALNTNALNIDWRAYGYRLGVAVLTALVLAIQKYFTAQGDSAPLAFSSVTPQIALAPSSPSLDPAAIPNDTTHPSLADSAPPPLVASTAPETIQPIPGATVTVTGDTPTQTVPAVSPDPVPAV